MGDINFNELRLLPGLKFEGDWTNDPLRTRQAILELVSQIPENRWWSLAAFVAAVREQHPDFQRPAGDYDSWFIRQDDRWIAQLLWVGLPRRAFTCAALAPGTKWMARWCVS